MAGGVGRAEVVTVNLYKASRYTDSQRVLTGSPSWLGAPP